MQIVIEIPEEAYELLKNKGVDWLGAEHILNAVANGIPLPKGHGRLIDADAIKAKHREGLETSLIDEERGINLSKYAEDACSQFDMFIDDNAPTIVEADGAEE